MYLFWFPRYLDWWRNNEKCPLRTPTTISVIDNPQSSIRDTILGQNVSLPSPFVLRFACFWEITLDHRRIFQRSSGFHLTFPWISTIMYIRRHLLCILWSRKRKHNLSPTHIKPISNLYSDTPANTQLTNPLLATHSDARRRQSLSKGISSDTLFSQSFSWWFWSGAFWTPHDPLAERGTWKPEIAYIDYP